MSVSLSFSPLVPWPLIVLLALLASLCLILRRPGRAGVLLLVSLLLLGFQKETETRTPLPDKVILALDESGSMKAAGRAAAAVRVFESLKASLSRQGIETAAIRIAGDAEGTALLPAVKDAARAILPAQRAGAILITDGRLEDKPEDLEGLGPVHAVIVGKKTEFDRRLTVVSAPRFGILGQEAQIAVRLDQEGPGPQGPVDVTVSQDGAPSKTVSLMPGVARRFSFPLHHPGQNVFSFSARAHPAEVSSVNNAAPVIVNAVRDRLKVLLVSGAPHRGERAWRNLLKSDAAVDLVHFTILRSLDSVDAASPSELSLIPFPVDELFEKKLSDFDLVIFDKYKSAGLISEGYFENIADYVRRGGAFLLAMGSGPEDAEDEQALFSTALAEMLPVVPRAGGAVARDYSPVLTPEGTRHPAASGLAGGQAWGGWLTQSRVTARSGAEVLMTGAEGLPLLITARHEQGRVAVLSSDNLWLWSRPGAGAGPYLPLLRTLGHWLMKEPELEDGFLKAEARGGILTVARRVFDPRLTPEVSVTTPTGSEKSLKLSPAAPGWMKADMEGADPGVYAFSSGPQGPRAFVLAGGAAGPEMQALRAGESAVAPIALATGGGVLWVENGAEPEVRGLPSGARRFAGEGWIAARKNGAEAVRGLDSRPLVAAWAAAFGVLFLLFALWRREGRA